MGLCPPQCTGMPSPAAASLTLAASAGCSCHCPCHCPCRQGCRPLAGFLCSLNVWISENSEGTHANQFLSHLLIHHSFCPSCAGPLLGHGGHQMGAPFCELLGWQTVQRSRSRAPRWSLLAPHWLWSGWVVREDGSPAPSTPWALLRIPVPGGQAEQRAGVSGGLCPWLPLPCSPHFPRQVFL